MVVLMKEAEEHYLDLFRMIRAAGRSDRDKAKAAANYVAAVLAQSNNTGGHHGQS